MRSYFGAAASSRLACRPALDTVAVAQFPVRCATTGGSCRGGDNRMTVPSQPPALFRTLFLMGGALIPGVSVVVAMSLYLIWDVIWAPAVGLLAGLLVAAIGAAWLRPWSSPHVAFPIEYMLLGDRLRTLRRELAQPNPDPIGEARRVAVVAAA